MIDTSKINFRAEPGTKFRLRCPWCNKGKGDLALKITINDNGTAGYWCYRCEAAGNIKGDHVTTPLRPCVAAQHKRAPARPTTQRGSLYARDLWRFARPITDGDPVDLYLRNRGCVRPPEDGCLRFLPKGRRQPWHRMLARVTDAVSGDLLTLHMTFITDDGQKAPIDVPKRLLKGHQKAGGIIRLWPDDAVTTSLAIAEGIETALTIARVQTPVWATVDAGNMKTLPVLNGIECLSVFADNDKAGTAASRAVIDRWAAAGVECWEFVPPKGDWNDIGEEHEQDI